MITYQTGYLLKDNKVLWLKTLKWTNRTKLLLIKLQTQACHFVGHFLQDWQNLCADEYNIMTGYVDSMFFRSQPKDKESRELSIKH